MSSIFGYTGNQFDLNPMKQKLSHWEVDRSDEHKSSKFNLGVLELFKTPECEYTSQPLKYESIVVSLDGRLDNREELNSKLNLHSEEKRSDVDYIAEAYLKWGTVCVDHLIGDFVFSIWDEKTETLFITRDQMGVKPVYYSVLNNELVFASEIKGILALPDFEKEINERYVVSCFSQFQIEKEETMYQNVFSLPPGCFLLFRSNKLSIEEYWYLGKNKPEIPKTVKEQVEMYGLLFNKSVQCRLRSRTHIGAEVSGGLDSTGIAAFAMQNLGKGYPFYSYCHGKPVRDHERKDDSGLVKEFCVENGILEYFSVINEDDIKGEDYIKFHDEILDDLDKNGVPIITTSFLPKAKQQNVNVMLSGWAGDQMVTSTAGGFYEALANKKMFGSLWKGLNHQHNFRKSLVRWIHYILKAQYNPFYNQNLKVAKQALKLSGINSLLIKKYKLDTIPSFRYYLKSCTDIQEYQRTNITHNGIVDRTVKHGLIGKHFNVDYRFPMLDIRLLEYIYHLPFTTTAPKGKTRFLFKQLIKGKVPIGVIELHKSKIATTPFIHSFYNSNEEVIRKMYSEIDKSKLDVYLKDDLFPNELGVNQILKYIQVVKKMD